MAGRTRRAFAPHFKAETVGFIQRHPEKSLTQVCQVLNLSRTRVARRAVRSRCVRGTSGGGQCRLQRGAAGRLLGYRRGRELFATLKLELLSRAVLPTRQQACSAIFADIQGFYNTRRRHSTLGYLSPAEYEARPGRLP